MGEVASSPSNVLFAACFVAAEYYRIRLDRFARGKAVSQSVSRLVMAIAKSSARNAGCFAMQN